MIDSGLRFSEHEQVVIRNDPASGLCAIIAIHSTALGAAAGGTRFRAYPTEAAAFKEALELSRAMTLKNSLAGTRCGGGKAVIMAGSAGKSTQILEAYGRLVESLGGRYITACDVGTDTNDLRVIGNETAFVTGRSREDGGLGDTAELTALSVLYAMETAAQFRWGTADLAKRTVNVLGVGKVGARLVEHLLERGAEVRVSDVNADAITSLRASHPKLEVLDPAEMIDKPAEIFSPCALGGVLNTESLGRLRAEIICGAANNQLESPNIADELQSAGVCYVPDYLANSGGVIQGAAEYFGEGMDSALETLARLRQTTAQVLSTAATNKTSTVAAADDLAWQRINVARGQSTEPVAAGTRN